MSNSKLAVARTGHEGDTLEVCLPIMPLVCSLSARCHTAGTLLFWGVVDENRRLRIIHDSMYCFPLRAADPL